MVVYLFVRIFIPQDQGTDYTPYDLSEAKTMQIMDLEEPKWKHNSNECGATAN
jgi:hypothetical protein